MDNSIYYAQLEQGARYLAAEASNADERRVHLGWANRYSRLILDAAIPVHSSLVRVDAHCS